MLKEFKKFAFKGNVVDMAVGVVVGGAFSTIVTSLVNDIIMPIFGFITAGMDFKNLKLVMSKAVVENGEIVKPEAAIAYGSFIQNIVNFFIIALSIFAIITIINKAIKKPEVVEEAPAPKAPTQEELLAEIRDLLKEQKEEA